MKNKPGRPKLSRQGDYAAKHYHGIQIRKSTKEILDVYCDEQRKSSGLKLSKVDIVDIAVRQVVSNGNFFQYAIDFNKNNK